MAVMTTLGVPENHLMHAVGNAMAVPVVGAVMASVLHGVVMPGLEPS